MKLKKGKIPRHIKSAKQSGFIKLLKLLNPKNLEKEVHVYGYHFSWKSQILLMLCSLLGIGAIGVLFKLQAVYFIISIAVVIFLLPVFVLDMYKKMFEQKRFSDTVTYLEQVLYSFQKSGKAVSALRECMEIFEDGQMKGVIGQAISYLESGRAQTEKGVLREALELIEKPYECTKLHTVHELLINSEEHGGNTDQSVFLVLEDIELWKRRGYKLQAEKKTSHIDNVISIVTATVLCAVALYVLDGMRTMFAVESELEIFQVEIIQVSSFLFILFQLYVLAKSSRNLTADWLQEEILHDAAYIQNSYATVKEYEEHAEKKKSILFALPFLIFAALAFFYKKWLAIPFLAVSVFMMLQHKVGYHLARKDVNEELYLALPQWLMQIALLMQNNNVQVSIARSAEYAPVVLQNELALLTARLKEEPDRLRSYTNFCHNFDVPEIQSCMKMLHAISESGTGNAQIQVNNLIQRVNEMQNMADEIRNRNTAFKMKLLFSYPVLSATVKLLADLTVGMIYMFQLLGGMGMGGA